MKKTSEFNSNYIIHSSWVAVLFLKLVPQFFHYNSCFELKFKILALFQSLSEMMVVDMCGSVCHIGISSRVLRVLFFFSYDRARSSKKKRFDRAHRNVIWPRKKCVSDVKYASALYFYTRVCVWFDAYGLMQLDLSVYLNSPSHFVIYFVLKMRIEEVIVKQLSH